MPPSLAVLLRILEDEKRPAAQRVIAGAQLSARVQRLTAEVDKASMARAREVLAREVASLPRGGGIA